MIVNQGDTFSVSGSANLLINGSIQKDMTGWTLSGYISMFDGSVKSIECDWVDVTNSTFYMRHIDTSDWIKGQATIEVTFIQTSTGYKQTAKSKPFSVV